MHIGDTRLYLLRSGALFQLTQDHTWVETQVDAGKLNRAQAAAHRQRALLVRALGTGIAVEADLALRTALAGDRYLLCSGGLSAVVDRAALQTPLTATSEPEQTVQRLTELAQAEGAPAKIACIVELRRRQVRAGTHRIGSCGPCFARRSSVGTRTLCVAFSPTDDA